VRDDDLTVGSFPPWFRRWGIGAWFVVGMALVVVAAVWLLSLTSSIVGPLIAGAVIGAVGGVVVDALERRGWPRVAGAAVVTLTLAALTLLVVGLVLGAITSQASHLDALLSQAVDKVQGWAQSLGITSAADAAQDIKKAAPDIGRTLLKGVASGISGLKSLVVFALALADEGTTSAIVMGLIIFAANGPLQQVVQPIVFGATLRLNPLVVFSVTIAAGTLFGMVGLILAAPLVSAGVRVHDHLADLRPAPAAETPSPAAEVASPP